MTQQPQQLKFGDRVRCKQTGTEGLIIDTGKTAAWIIWEGQKCANFYAYGTFEAVPHPDTSRLDWLIKTKHAILPGWCGDVYADSREEIDAAMNTPTSQQIEKEQS